MVEEAKREIRRIKHLDVESTRRALRMFHQAFAVGSETLAILQGQGNRLFNAEDTLSEAAIANEEVAQKLKELKRANRLIRIDSPFVAIASASKKEVDHISTDEVIRECRDVQRAAKWQDWKENRVHSFTSVPLHRGATAQQVLDRARFQFEDSEDEDLEDIIDDNLEELLKTLPDLKGSALESDAELK